MTTIFFFKFFLQLLRLFWGCIRLDTWTVPGVLFSDIVVRVNDVIFYSCLQRDYLLYCEQYFITTKLHRKLKNQENSRAGSLHPIRDAANVSGKRH